MQTDDDLPQAFNFLDHGRAATAEYLSRQTFYRDLASAASRILEECLQLRNIKVQTVQHREKSAEGFSGKAATPSESNPNEPKYHEPLREITDLSGVRIITYFKETLSHIDVLLRDEFQIIERSNKGDRLLEEERFGYQSVHYRVILKSEITDLSEYHRYAGALIEIQVRTILQHAWAEIEHDIQYKSSTAIPNEIRRRFMALAGMLEIADREFEAIGNANMALENHAEKMVERGDVDGLEITPNSLKLFLDSRLGPDGRISEWSYDWTTRSLRQIGFRNLQQIKDALSKYDDNEVGQAIYGSRQGQTARFEAMLLAAMGKTFVNRHPLSAHSWFPIEQESRLKKLEAAGIPIGTYDPDHDAVGRGEMAEGWPEKVREAQHTTSVIINGREHERIRCGSEKEGCGADDQPCHDCGVLKGQVHVENCDIEECPVCQGQLISCGCPN